MLAALSAAIHIRFVKRNDAKLLLTDSRNPVMLFLRPHAVRGALRPRHFPKEGQT